MPFDQLILFGGHLRWHSRDWTASDDRVRGGKSQSHLDLSSSNSVATFRGVLDITALGGAGFASQRTSGDDREWDLSEYDGIELDIQKADDKQYTFILKDTILPPNPDNGREQSTISYEHDFKAFLSASDDSNPTVFIPWDRFTATYRGKKIEDAPDLDLKKIKRISLMNRSFFGRQEGKFSISFKSIKATMQPSSVTMATEVELYRDYEQSRREGSLPEKKVEIKQDQRQGIIYRLLHLCKLQ